MNTKMSKLQRTDLDTVCKVIIRPRWRRIPPKVHTALLSFTISIKVHPGSIIHHLQASPYLAMTSTYPRPFFFPLTVPPFLAAGAPIRSSIVAVPAPPPIPVLGLEGGADGGPEGGPEDGANRGDTESGKDLMGNDAFSPAELVGMIVVPMLGDTFREGTLELGGLDSKRLLFRNGGVCDVPTIADGPAALTVRDGGPLGGGGVAAKGAALVPPSFLLIHLFRLGSYSNEFVSPRRAWIGPLDEAADESLAFPPPSQPLNQEDLAALV